MRILALIFFVLLTSVACRTARQTPAESPFAETPGEQAIPTEAAPTDGPAQAQTSEIPAFPPSDEAFRAADAFPQTPLVRNVPEATASTQNKPAARYWQKSLAVPKLLLKTAEKQMRNIAKKRHPNDNTILGLRPILFFALLAVLAGVILLFVTGKSQFFSILTVVLLVGGLIVSLGAFLDLI